MLGKPHSDESDDERDSLPRARHNPHDIVQDSVYDVKEPVFVLHPATVVPTANINFDPLPTTSAKSSKLKLGLVLDSNHFLAGHSIKGRLELLSFTSDSLYISEIKVLLVGSESLKDQTMINFDDKSKAWTFLHQELVLQGPKYNPSIAVTGPWIDGYYLAKKGKTVFEFAFELSKDCPPSFEFQNLANVSYTVTGMVVFKHGDSKDVMFKKKQARVLDIPIYSVPTPISVNNYQTVLMGGSGNLFMEASLATNIVYSGSPISIEINVRNNTKRKINGLRISFVKELVLNEGCLVDGPLETAVCNCLFKDKEFCYEPGEERYSIIHQTVPNDVYSVVNTMMSKVLWKVLVAVQTPGLLNVPGLNKELVVELPIMILHPFTARNVQPLDRHGPEQKFIDFDAFTVDYSRGSSHETSRYSGSYRGSHDLNHIMDGRYSGSFGDFAHHSMHSYVSHSTTSNRSNAYGSTNAGMPPLMSQSYQGSSSSSASVQSRSSVYTAPRVPALPLVNMPNLSDKSDTLSINSKSTLISRESTPVLGTNSAENSSLSIIFEKAKELWKDNTSVKSETTIHESSSRNKQDRFKKNDSDSISSILSNGKNRNARPPIPKEDIELGYINKVCEQTYYDKQHTKQKRRNRKSKPLPDKPSEDRFGDSFVIFDDDKGAARKPRSIFDW